MQLKFILGVGACWLTLFAFAQQKSLLAGPMLAHTELRTAKVWAEFRPDVSSATIWTRESDKPGPPKLNGSLRLKGGAFNTAVFSLVDLEPGKTYRYYIKAGNDRSFSDSGQLTTQEYWQGRVPAPDFSFIAGSCSHFSEAPYDRPAGDSTIFLTMAKENAAFMLWLGDNWYTREVDYHSDWGLYARASRDRRFKIIQPLLKAMPHYAIWDDHDYGPNDADKSYVLKETSRNVFKTYWANPSCGLDGQGVFSKFTWNDVDFFLLDDRWFRSNDRMPDSIGNQPNPDKKMLGDMQLDWLKNALLQSVGNPRINFRVIVNGSQVLNPVSTLNCLKHYPVEYNELIGFISANRINGVLFMTGDRHHSEIISAQRNGGYPLYDITSSPLTSGVAKAGGAEINNPARIGKEIDLQNYARISFTGQGKERKLEVRFIGIKGDLLGQWEVRLGEISY
jgi:alkaline phosphatase D